MRRLEGFFRKNIANMILAVLVLANILVWRDHIFSGFPVERIYSSGTLFSADDIVINFTDKLEFKDEYFNFSARYNWNEKSNTMQETGTASQGLRGELDLTVNNSSSFGSSMLVELRLEDDFLFSRSYMQGGQARISLLPLTGEFSTHCYYVLVVRKVHCGASILSSLSRLQSESTD